jgi:hypothetical protein
VLENTSLEGAASRLSELAAARRWTLHRAAQSVLDSLAD